MRQVISKRGFVLTAFSLAIVHFSYSCSRTNIPVIAEYFGTKGRYEEVNPYLIDDIFAVNKSLLKPPSTACNAVHLTALIRHGTRYPTIKNIRKMKDVYNLVLNESINSVGWLHQIKTEWEMWYTEDMDGRIVEKGRDDHRHLAARLAISFPSLFTEENLRSNRIKFITSSKHRCQESIIAFKEGLLKLWNVTDVEFKHEVNDELMRFFDQCKRFIEDVENNKTALMEVDLFKSTPEMRTVLKNMADRLMVPESLVTTDLVEAAFHLCAYEFAIKSVNSPWCNLFDEVDAQVLEYKNDLKQYWKRGHGYDINRKSSCTLFHDVFRRLDLAANEIRFGQVTEAVTVQVGHAETLLPLLSLMGFFKDEVPLTSVNYEAQRDRTFRSGRIVPYAANMVFVLYDCEEGLRLQFLLNEKPVAFPNICDSAPLYQVVKENYKDLLQGCNFELECELPRTNLSKCSEL